MKKILLALLFALPSLAAAGFSWHLYSDLKHESKVQLGSQQAVGGILYYLAGSGVGSSDNEITLTSFRQPVNQYQLSMTDFGDIGYLTLEPGNVNHQEFVSFTGIENNSDGSATLTGVIRGLAPVYPFTASSTIQKAHAGGTIATLSNPPQFYQQFISKFNTGTSSAVTIFGSTTPPRLDVPGLQASGTYNATTSEFVTWAGLVAVTNAGTVNGTTIVKGIYQTGTGLQTGSSTALGSTGAALVLTTANATDTPQSSCASGFSSAGAECTVIARLNGKISQAWLDLSAAASWVFNGAVSLLGDVVIAASSGHPWTLNGVSRAEPSSTPSVASSTVRYGTGTPAVGVFRPMGLVYASTTPTSISGSSASTTIFSFTLPGNTLGTTGALTCDIFGHGTLANSNNTHAEFSYGYATTTPDLIKSNASGGNLLGFNVFRMSIQAIGLSSQKITVYGNSDANGTNNDVYEAGTTIAVDSTANQLVQFVIKNSTTDSYTADAVQCFAN